jgi:glycosyltransferase involved in cell wall biosynthesis
VPEAAPRASDLPSRVLVVAPQPFYADRGTPIAVRYVLEALSELGVAADLLTFPMGRDVAIPGVRVLRAANPLRIRDVPVGLSAQKLVIDILLFARLWRQLRRERYEVLHAVEEAAMLAGLVLRRRPPLLYDMASSLPEQLAQKRWLRAAWLQGLFRRLERALLGRAGFVVCSAGLSAYVAAAAPGVAHREWRFPARPPQAGPGEIAALRAELGLPEGAPTVVYAGNFEAYQGVDLLLAALPEALRSVPEAHAVLVGAANEAELGAARDTLPEAVRSRVHLLPRQPRERIDGFVALADLLVSPRRYGRNFPLKLFDYLAAGKPVVATDVPAHRAVLDERLALLVSPTPVGLAAGIVRVLSEPALAARLGAAARRFADAELAWPVFVQGIAAIYAATLAGGRP